MKKIEIWEKNTQDTTGILPNNRYALCAHISPISDKMQSIPKNNSDHNNNPLFAIINICIYIGSRNPRYVQMLIASYMSKCTTFGRPLRAKSNLLMHHIQNIDIQFTMFMSLDSKGDFVAQQLQSHQKPGKGSFREETSIRPISNEKWLAGSIATIYAEPKNDREMSFIEKLRQSLQIQAKNINFD